MFESYTGLARALLSSPPHPVLEGPRKKLSFEIVVGINGRFWVNASQLSTVILLGNAIQKSESLSLVLFLLSETFSPK
ncbi:putative exosome complex RNA-binding protein 1/RRP40/RRP4 [Helianthus annuus]|nr:putative exosome complex RNA-binding protein 1/RRP40/RRP4 [Helianthus annuus]